MPYDDGENVLHPQKAAMHIWDGALWQEWTGVLTTGDIEIGAVEIKDADSDVRTIVTVTGCLQVKETDDTLYATATGSAAIAYTLAPGFAFDLQEVRLHLSAAGNAGNFTITADNNAGAAYDVVVYTLDLTSVINICWQPTRPMRFNAGDELDFAWANAIGRTYGLEIFYTRHIFT